MLPNIGFGELLVVLLVVLLLFGAKRLPELAKGIGRSLKAFKEGLNEASSEVQDVKRAVIDAKEEAQLIPPPQKPAASISSKDQENSKVAIL